MRPLHRLPSLAIDIPVEIRKILKATGGAGTRDGTLSAAYKAYTSMKTLGFFSIVMGAFGNIESLNDMSLRTYDIFFADTGKGRLVFVVACSREALDAFTDDGLVLLKVRDWLGSSYEEVIKAGPGVEDERLVGLWDRTFSRPGAPLPRGVSVIPFYKEGFADGAPGVVLVLVKDKK